jgi:hypothetical protein
MQGKERIFVTAYSPADKLIILERKFEQDQVVIVLNFANTSRYIPSGFRKQLIRMLDSNEIRWAGSGSVAASVWEPGQTLGVPAFSVCAYEFNEQ